MTIPVPREHGAWAMLGLSGAAGWLASPSGSAAAGVLALAGILGAFFAQAAWLARESSGRLWMAEILVAATATAVAGFRQGLGYWPLVAAVGAVAGLAQWARFRQAKGGRVRLAAFGSHLAGAASLAGCAAIVGSARGGADTGPLLFLWWTLALAFAGGVFLVQATMPGRERSAVGLVAVAVAAIATVALVASPGRLHVALALSPILLRCLLVPLLRRRPIGWKRTGWLETALGVWTVFWLA